MNPAFDSAWNTYVKDSMPLVATIIGAFGGGIVSGFLVHILTQSRDREKWVLDCKKQEYRELLTGISLAHKIPGANQQATPIEKILQSAKQSH
jgi:hypothetical protein